MATDTPLTLDEAIDHAQAAADRMMKSCSSQMKMCGAEHQQLAQWLRELKELRAQKGATNG